MNSKTFGMIALIVVTFAAGFYLGKQKTDTNVVQTGCKTEQVMLEQCLTAIEEYKKQLETGRPEGCPKTAVESVGTPFCGKRAKNVQYDKSQIIVTCYDGRVLNFTLSK